MRSCLPAAEAMGLGWVGLSCSFPQVGDWGPERLPSKWQCQLFQPECNFHGPFILPILAPCFFLGERGWGWGMETVGFARLELAPPCPVWVAKFSGTATTPKQNRSVFLESPDLAHSELRDPRRAPSALCALALQLVLTVSTKKLLSFLPHPPRTPQSAPV